MEQYINKAALVAEIEKELNTTKKYSTEYVNGKKYALKKILTFLDTLEAKKVDLEKEVKDYIYAIPHAKTGIPNGWRLSWHEEDVIEIAKHFYELGLKAQKGE